jgi:hypothetical protein
MERTLAALKEKEAKGGDWRHWMPSNADGTPAKPTPKQQQFLDLTCFEALLGGAAGGGKLLDIETPIPTPSGFVTMGDLRPGDTVFGRDGTPCTVLAESAVVTAPAYLLTFDDRSSVVANDEHRWLTYDASDLADMTRRCETFRAKRRANRPRRTPTGNKSDRFRASLAARNAAAASKARSSLLGSPTGSVKTTAEIAASVRTSDGRANHAIPVCGALVMPVADLPIDPYVLGAWLGDGTSSTGAITSMDPEIVANVAAGGFPVRSTYRTPSQPSAKASLYKFTGLTTALRQLGVLNNKHVPSAYLWASVEQRTALLQGLMDTDGGVEGGSAAFTNTRRDITEAVAHLARSLGHRARVVEGEARLNGRVIGPVWSVKFTPHVPVFRLPRKLAALPRIRRRTTHFRYLQAAERVAPVPMKCIQVSSPDGLFLCTRDMIPTHNSSALLMAALQYVHVPGYAALILRRTFADLSLPNAIMDRALSWWVPKGVRWDSKDKRATFPSGATVTFGYLETENDKYRYQGAELQTILVDELTQFGESQYRYLLSRLRRRMGVEVPLRMRSATNPGGIGHEWVKRRFIDPHEEDGRIFVPAFLDDNPYLDRDEYRLALAQLDPITRKQLLEGIWVRDAGGLVYGRFDEKHNVVESLPMGRTTLDHYLLGIDYGFTDSTAYSVLGWNDHDQTVYVVECFKTQSTTPSDAAEGVARLTEKYQFEKIVADVGGLGKGYAEEARRRFHLPIDPAQKFNKIGYISILNGALADRKLMLLRGTTDELAKEWLELPWAKGRRRDEADRIHDEAEGFENHCCLVAGSRVLTELGERDIESLRRGDRVMGRNGLQTVLGCLTTSPRPIWRLTTEDGREVEGTHDHPFWTPDGWKQLSDLVPGDTLYAWRTSTDVASRSSSTASSTADTLTPSSENCASTTRRRLADGCTETYGHRFTGPYHAVTTYTTSTRTLSTTIQAILRCCLEPSIDGCTPARQRALSAADAAYARPLPPRPHGTPRPTGSPGTQRMGTIRGSIGRSSITSARFAGPASEREASPRACAAATASPGKEESPASTTRAASARGAAPSSGRTNTPSRHLAPCRVRRVERTPYASVTYNLTVDGDHEYFANDILVSNCDATLYGFRACTAFAEDASKDRPALATKAYYDEMESNLIELAEDKYGRGDHTDWWLT